MQKMKKSANRFLAILLAVMMLFSMLPTFVFASEADLEIGTREQLNNFAKQVNSGESFEGKTIIVTADIALGGESDPWTPIGTSSNPFKGTFDGGGHVVSGLSIASGTNVGLFGYVDGGTVKNITVQGSVNGSSAAGVVGYLNAGTVQNCGNQATVSGSANVGGVVGNANNTCSIKGCYNTGAVSGTTGYIGGVVGYVWGTATITDSYNTGTISGPATVGGIAGGHKAKAVNCENCYNAGKLDCSGSNNIGAVVGATRGGSLTNCYYVTGTWTQAVGNDAGASGVTAADSISADSLGSAFMADNDNINNGYPVLTWQEIVPDIIIATYEQLKAFADDVNDGNAFEGKLIRLDANIALGGESNPWTPIGTSSNPFKGTFDGNYHVVSELYASGTNVGLFGYVDGGTVKNITVQGSVNGSSAAGVVGYLNAGTVQNCGNQATVSGSANVGGVVGYANNTCSIKGCYNMGAVSGTTGYIGGVVGYVWGTATITDSYNTGTISGPATVGGIAGGHKAKAVNCENCYNAGKLDCSGSNNIGAVVGATRGGSLTNCYYVTGTWTQAVGNDAGASGVTAADSISADSLGSAFTDKDGKTVLIWEANVDTGKPVRPQFVEKTELSKTLAEYIRQAIDSKKTHANPSIIGTLLGNESTLNGASSTETDWIALAMGRFGYFDSGDGSYYNLYDDGDGYEQYLNALKNYMEETYAAQDGVLHSAKATEWHRAVVAIMALGGDPTSFGTYNGKSINLIADGSYNCVIKDPGKQGINGWIWGLISMDTGRFTVPSDAAFDRGDFITEILKMQLTDGVNGNKYGGWVLAGYGTVSDVDITAMAIQALAPYYNDDTVYTYTNEISNEKLSKTVRECVDEALERLSSMMNKEGGFTSWDANNVESISQVVVALTSLGIDPTKDSRFVTSDGKTLLDGMLKFRMSDGGFMHVANGGWNSMATDQATYALVSVWRQQNGMRALYDMREDWTDEELRAIENAVELIENLPEPADNQYKAKLKEALAAFRNVPEDERQYVGNYSTLADAIKMVGGEDKLDTNDPYITKIEVTTPPDKIAYYEGEVFDASGMVVTAFYSDGTKKTLLPSAYTYTPYDELEIGNDTIYISSGSLKTTLSITVTEKMPWEGAGTESDPYLIKTADDLVTLDEYVRYENMDTYGVYFQMTQDINLKEVKAWHAIGADTNRGFCGHFDGNGYAVWNLTTVEEHNTNGLFGLLGDGAVIENLGIASGTIGYSIEASCGGIAAAAIGDATIRNCWNQAAVGGTFGVGGILGEVRSNFDGETVTVTIEKCYNKGTITAGYDGGGIVGRVGESNATDKKCRVIIKDCYNTGEVKGSGQFGNGGIIGNIRYCSNDTVSVLENCYNTGSISGKVTGALIGSAPSSKAELKNSYYLAGTSAEAVGTYEEYTQTIVGQGISKTADEMKADSMVSVLGAAYAKDGDSVNSGYPILSGQKAVGEEPPVRAGLEIGTAEELAEFAARVNDGESFKNKTIALTNHIDLSDYDSWTPIGKSNAQFEGTFDGCGYVIDNLYVTSAYGGLFGVVGSNAVIKNVGVASGQIGADTGRQNFLGGIAGWSNGTDFINCWNGADIYGNYAGGIVGTVRDGGESTITGCYNTGDVISLDEMIGGDLGGIVGQISASSNGTNVTVTIENCYNTGNLEGASNIGGIVGRAQDGHTFRNCYNVGEVTATYENMPYAGAIAGTITKNNYVENCYFDNSKCAAAFGNGTPSTAEAEGKTTQEMTSDSFAELLGDGFKADRFALVNAGYPLVQWQATEEANMVEDVMNKIAAIGTVTLESADAVNQARNAYDALDEDLKSFVTNLSVLEAAEASLAAIQTLEEAKDTAIAQLESYKDASSYRQEQQEELAKVLADGKVAIKAATDISGVNAALTAAKQEVDAIPTDAELTAQEDAKAVSDMIESIGNVTLESEQAIIDARKAYDALSDSAKDLVSNYELLVQAESELAELKDQQAGDTSNDDGNGSVSEGDNTDSPSTGDSSNPVLWTAMLVAGAACLLLLSIKKSKANQF